MDARLESLDAFRAAIASLSLPLDEEELRTAWAMVQDLRAQADGLRAAVHALGGSEHLTAPLDDPRGRRRG
jgi:hypothetical protein